jgi:hypothetical protein
MSEGPPTNPQVPKGRIDIQGIRGMCQLIAGRHYTMEELKATPSWREREAELWQGANHLPWRVTYPSAMVQSAISDLKFKGQTFDQMLAVTAAQDAARREG